MRGMVEKTQEGKVQQGTRTWFRPPWESKMLTQIVGCPLLSNSDSSIFQPVGPFGLQLSSSCFNSPFNIVPAPLTRCLWILTPDFLHYNRQLLLCCLFLLLRDTILSPPPTPRLSPWHTEVPGQGTEPEAWQRQHWILHHTATRELQHYFYLTSFFFFPLIKEYHLTSLFHT